MNSTQDLINLRWLLQLDEQKAVSTLETLKIDTPKPLTLQERLEGFYADIRRDTHEKKEYQALYNELFSNQKDKIDTAKQDKINQLNQVSSKFKAYVYETYEKFADEFGGFNEEFKLQSPFDRKLVQKLLTTSPDVIIFQEKLSQYISDITAIDSRFQNELHPDFEAQFLLTEHPDIRKTEPFGILGTLLILISIIRFVELSLLKILLNT